mgnify:CR=1 FL=1
MHIEANTLKKTAVVNRRKYIRRKVHDRRAMIRFAPGEEISDRRFNEDRRESERLDIWNIALNG